MRIFKPLKSRQPSWCKTTFLWELTVLHQLFCSLKSEMKKAMPTKIKRSQKAMSVLTISRASRANPFSYPTTAPHKRAQHCAGESAVRGGYGLRPTSTSDCHLRGAGSLPCTVARKVAQYATCNVICRRQMTILTPVGTSLSHMASREPPGETSRPNAGMRCNYSPEPIL